MMRVRACRGVLVACVAFTALVCVTGCAVSSTAATSARASATSAQPTVAPTATPTAQERLFAALAEQAVSSLTKGVQASYNASDGKVSLTATVDNPIPSTAEDALAAQDRVRIICLRIQQALWTSGVTPSDVLVSVMGSVMTDYGDTALALWGVAELRAATAKSFAWTSLDPLSAWNAYDGQWLRTGYRPSQVWGVVTPPPHP